MTTFKEIQNDMKKASDTTRAQAVMKYFKCGPGDYADGDKFLGIDMGTCRKIAKQYHNVEETIWSQMLASQWHEERMIALLIMTLQFESGDFTKKHDIVDAYLRQTQYINNWDLVDVSAYKILGAWKVMTRTSDKTPALLQKLARSEDLWERRIAIVCTYTCIKAGWYEPTYDLAEQLLGDTHDLMHKAVGWMLREAGKRDEARLRNFIDMHATQMPRTMLRYAIEKFDNEDRKHYLSL